MCSFHSLNNPVVPVSSILVFVYSKTVTGT